MSSIPALRQIADLAQNEIDRIPPRIIKVGDWWLPKPNNFVRPCFARMLADGRIAAYYMKTGLGWPWDINIIDPKNGVFFRVTENDAIDKITGIKVGWPPQGHPYTYRLYSPAFKISPATYAVGGGTVEASNVLDVPTLRYSSCAAAEQNHLGPARSSIYMASRFSWGKDLGIQDTLISQYYYNKELTREQFYLTELSGWAGWDVADFRANDQKWVVRDSVMHNTFVPDTIQVPIFPCNVKL
jgi:hypothetical protein